MTQGGSVKTSRTVGDGRKDRWQAHRAARRDAMVAAAVRAIHRHGPDVAMRDIAAEAQVSKTVLYRHFADQRDLYHAIGRQAGEWLIQQLTAQLDPEGEPAAVVAAVVDAYLSAIEADPQLYRFVVRYAFADQSSPDAVDGYRTIVADHVERVLHERLVTVGADASVSAAWAAGLVGLVQTAGEWWLDHPSSLSRSQLGSQLTTLIWGGLSNVIPG